MDDDVTNIVHEEIYSRHFGVKLWNQTKLQFLKLIKN